MTELIEQLMDGGYKMTEREIGRYKCSDPVKGCPQPDSREIDPDGKYVQD